MKSGSPLSIDEVGNHFKKRLGDDVEDIKKEKIRKGVKEKAIEIMWLTVKRERFRDAVNALAELHTPHLSVTSGSDIGEYIELIYHFQVNYGHPGKEISVNLKVHLPKKDPTIPTITDIVPGALTTEREKQEFLGVQIKNIPDSRRLWLADDFPEDKYPWRWDETGMEEMSRYVHDEEDETFDKPIAKYPRKKEVEEKKKRKKSMEEEKKKKEDGD